VGKTSVAGQRSRTTTQTVTIDPTDYTFTPTGDGCFAVTVACKNVIVSDPRMIDTSPVIRYIHPNLLTDGVKNVRIVDFGVNENSKPKKYGKVVFGSNVSGDLNSKSYEYFEHLGYWTTSGNYNNLYRTDNVAGDYFIQLLDYNGNVPSIEWFFPNQTTSGNAKTGYGNGFYGIYEGKYSFSGLHRVFFPYGEQEYHTTDGARVNLISSGADKKMAFVFGGFTAPVNHALLNNGYQAGAGTGEIAPPDSVGGIPNTPDAGVMLVTIAACEKLKSEMGSNTKIYVIAYRMTNSDKATVSEQMQSCLNGASDLYFQSATSEETLNEALSKIAADIKIFANHRESRVEEITQ
jgi:hypothetical protein